MTLLTKIPAPPEGLSPQHDIDRLMALSRRATRHRHFTWAANLEAWAVAVRRTARFDAWRVELSPTRRAGLGILDAIPLLCECCPTDTAATEWVGGIALCPVCAAAEKADAFSMAEDV